MVKRRQGQKKTNGKTAKPKPICPHCDEYMLRCYNRSSAENKRAYVGVGWNCPNPTCDYIIKDFVEIGEEEGDEQ